MKLHAQEDRLPDFRNPNGVAQKTRNLDPAYPRLHGKRVQGQQEGSRVVERFIAEAPRPCHELADPSARRWPLANRCPQAARAGRTSFFVSLKDITALPCSSDRRYDELGQDAFLSKHGFGLARSYFLTRATAKTYDSKAIVGVAHGYLPAGSRCPQGEFSGGEHGGAAASTRFSVA